MKQVENKYLENRSKIALSINMAKNQGQKKYVNYFSKIVKTK